MHRADRILIVPDKFKGTLSAAEACATIAKGWKSARPNDELDLLPMSDGGDGFGKIMAELSNAQTRTVKTLDAAHCPIRANWWYARNEKLALIESARVVGLNLLLPGKFHPFQLDTFGLGKVLDDTIRVGAKRCLIGIGGSATNDAGFGLARALGWKFLNESNDELGQWWQLANLARIIPPPQKFSLPITVAVDVSNPLLGPQGCTRIYGPQKGIRSDDISHAENCLHRLKTVFEKQFKLAFASTPGAGAAGGLGFGLMAFAGAKSRSGFEVFAEAVNLEKRIRQSDLVITGEGAIDRQTCMGKGVGRVMQLCRKSKVPCIAVAGMVGTNARTARRLAQTFALTDITTLDHALRQPAHYLHSLSTRIAGRY